MLRFTYILNRFLLVNLSVVGFILFIMGIAWLLNEYPLWTVLTISQLGILAYAIFSDMVARLK